MGSALVPRRHGPPRTAYAAATALPTDTRTRRSGGTLVIATSWTVSMARRALAVALAARKASPPGQWRLECANAPPRTLEKPPKPRVRLPRLGPALGTSSTARQAPATGGARRKASGQGGSRLGGTAAVPQSRGRPRTRCAVSIAVPTATRTRRRRETSVIATSWTASTAL